MFKRLNHITDNLYEVDIVKSEIEHRGPIIVGFFILQYAKLRMLELYYKFFRKFCDTDKNELPEMVTDYLYLALYEENLEDVILPENELNGTSYLLKIALITLLWMQPTVFSPELAVMPTRNMIRESRDYIKKRLDVEKGCACVPKPVFATIERVKSTNSVARDSKKEL